MMEGATAGKSQHVCDSRGDGAGRGPTAEDAKDRRLAGSELVASANFARQAGPRQT